MGTHYKSRGASNEYPQHKFLWRNKKNANTSGLKKASYQELCVRMCRTALDKRGIQINIFLNICSH